MNDQVLNAAAILSPPELRSLYAIHLATAQQFESDLAEMIVYDYRLAEAAMAMGLRVKAPA